MVGTRSGFGRSMEFVDVGQMVVCIAQTHGGCSNRWMGGACVGYLVRVEEQR